MTLARLLCAVSVAGCGGGEKPPPPVVKAPVLLASTQVPAVVLPAAEPTPEPVSVPTEPVLAHPAWRVEWSQDWKTSAIGGWTRVEGKWCQSVDDPGFVSRNDLPVGDWTAIGPVAATMDDGHLVVDSTSPFALVSGRTFDVSVPLRAEAVVDLTPDKGAWVGLAVWNGEGNYREIGISSDGKGLRVVMNAPCYVVGLQPLDVGPKFMSIEYDPAIGWSMSVDGVVYEEKIGYRANTLLGPSNVGLWFVNLDGERGGSDRLVRAKVGPVTVRTP